MKQTWRDRTKQKMKEHDLTQHDLAKFLGITRGAAGHYLTGRRQPTIEQVQEIAKFCRVSLSWLVEGKKDPK